MDYYILQFDNKSTMVKWYTMISFHHSRLLHTASWQVFILERHKKESIFHHGDFINTAIRECSFSGWGQFLQSFCRSTSEFVISRVVKPQVIWHIHECSCKSFAKIVPIQESHSQIARPLAKSNFLTELKNSSNHSRSGQVEKPFADH